MAARGSGFTPGLPPGVYLPALALFGFAHPGAVIVGDAFVIEIAPGDRRRSYTAFLDTVSLPVTFLLAVVGWAVGGSTSGPDGPAVAASGPGAVTFAAASRLAEVRV